MKCADTPEAPLYSYSYTLFHLNFHSYFTWTFHSQMVLLNLYEWNDIVPSLANTVLFKRTRDTMATWYLWMVTSSLW